MATITIYPNSNVYTNTFEICSYNRIDETGGYDNIYNYCHLIPDGGVGEMFENGYGSVPTYAVVTSLKFYMCFIGGSSGVASVAIAPRISGSLQSEQTYSIPTPYQMYYPDKTWNGSWTKSQIDGMSFRMRVTSLGGNYYTKVYCEYIRCVVTYTLNPPYNKVINGVSGYTHINGVAVLDIDAWNGVS